MFSPKYDNPLEIKDVKNFFENNNCKVVFAGFKKYEKMKAAVVKVVKY